MKVYVDFKDLDAEDMPSNISNNYNLQVKSINGGSDYKNIEIKSLADYTKQVRKEVCEEIRGQLDKISGEHTVKINGGIGKFTCVSRYALEELLDQIQD